MLKIRTYNRQPPLTTDQLLQSVRGGRLRGAGALIAIDALIDILRRPTNTLSVHRLTGFILVFAFAAVGSGAMEHVHRMEHSAGACASIGRFESWRAPCDPGHDEQNCAICLTLHAPYLAAGYVPLLICLGLWVAFLSCLTPRLNPQRVLAFIDCRGPPLL